MNSRADQIAKTILSHLRETGQLNLLGQVVHTLTHSPEAKTAKCLVTLTSTVAFTTPELRSLTSYLRSHTPGKYTLTQVVDPSLIAGFTLQINDTLVDASILGKIKSVQNSINAKD